MDKIVELLSQHYEWLFSGLGITVIGIVGRYIIKKFSNEKVDNVNKETTYKNEINNTIKGNNNINGNNNIYGNGNTVNLYPNNNGMRGTHGESDSINIDKEQMQAASLLYNDLVSIGNYLAKERSSVNLRYCSEWQKMVAVCSLLSETQRKDIYDIYDDVYNYNFFYEQKLKRNQFFSKEDIPQYGFLKEKIFDRSKGYIDTDEYNSRFENVLGALKTIMKGM